MPRKLTIEEFIKQAKLAHGERYDYSITKYINRRTKVKIICPTHGIFEQNSDHHNNGRGCPYCGGTRKLTTGLFIEKAREIHRNKYDYSKSLYINNKIKVEIICKIHGSFWQKPAYHLGGSDCPSCVGRKQRSLEEFVQEANEVHDSKYDYSSVVFLTTKKKVEIICPVHNSFWQTPECHLIGQGCPTCGKLSVGEETIAKILQKWEIVFTRQKRFNECRDKGHLPFDFYFQLNSSQFLIEYDGIQHFKPIAEFGGEEGLRYCQRHDAIRNKFAEKNGFILIRIPYTEFNNIETILKKKIEYVNL